tara:strand:- start:1052 stop:1504 length:453 start_codon:yes stop_codon:yes gene_type:complete
MEQTTKMLKRLTNLTYGMAEELKKDPVRPSISPSKRIGRNKDVFYEMSNKGEIDAVVCVTYTNDVPTDESNLFDMPGNDIAIFYSVWSNRAGAGRKIIFDTVEVITNENNNIQRFVTLSPDTKIAERFHLRNGAIVFRTNDNTVNYEYLK